MGTQGRQEIYINLIHYPVRTLGIGQRVGIWFQGCSIHCEGCIAEYTWESDPSCRMTVGEVLERVIAFRGFDPDGITVSGGEPFDQPKGLFALLGGIRSAGIHDIMVYSGYRFEHLEEEYKDIFELIDVLVDGPFKKGLDTPALWKGSDNQRMIILSKDEALRERYLKYMTSSDGKRTLQIVEKGDKVYIIGIPQQKDVEVIKHGLG
jgi:anaerobic ribonucleoside-triphosphate reductase activating protein